MATRKLSTKLLPIVTPTPVQLPFWHTDLRGLPNAWARSALFKVSHARNPHRAYLRSHPIASLKGLTIEYTGEELRQDDEDVMLQILHLARMQPLGSVVEFRASAMIAELKWTRNKGSYQRLAACITRLTATALGITIEDEARHSENYTGSLIRSFQWRDETTMDAMRNWQVLLEPKIISLFQTNTYSRLDWETRLKLPPLAKWLHSFYHSHQTPFAFKVETLHRISGSDIAELRQFRYKLKAALAQLVECGFLVSAVIDPRTDTAAVERTKPRPALEQ